MSHDSASWTPTATTDTAAASVSPDALFEVLAHEYRRQALVYLLAHGGDGSVDDLVAHVASETEGTEQRQLAITFHHRHFPKMEDAGVIAYDQQHVTVRDAAGAIESALHAVC